MLRMPSVLALGVLWLMHPASRKMRSLANDGIGLWEMS